MRLFFTLIFGVMIICGEVYLGVQTFYPELLTSQASLVDEIIEEKNTIYPSLNAEELEWLSSKKTVIVGTDPHFYPLETFDERGQYTGLGSDYMKLLSHLTGLEFKVHRGQDWAEAERYAQSKEVDVFMAAVETDRRNVYMQFTDPYIKLSGMIVARRDTANTNKSIRAESLAGKKIAVVRNYFWHDYLVENYPDLDLILATNTLEALNFVANNDADFVVDYAFNLREQMQLSGLYQLEAVGELESDKGHAMAVRKDLPELINIVNIAYNSITPSEHESLAQKWLSSAKPIGSEQRIQWYFFFFTQAFLLVLGVIAWSNSKANNAVHEKIKQLKAKTV